MATTLPQTRSASPAKYDAAVEVYLARARGRIRSLDALVGVLVLASGALAFTVAMVLADRWLVLSPLSRQLALAAFGLAALLYLAFGLVVPLGRRINPYFAARHLEQVVPGSKNSVVNWLDLRGEALPPAIRAAVGQRALRDLANADLEQAISGRRAAWLGGLTAALALAALVTLALLGARPFFSLLGRTFAPFREGAIATRTSLTLVEPQGGDATVPVGHSVRVAVEVDGRVPEPGKADAIRLRFHYQPGDPDEERPLERENGDLWATTLPAFQVQNGFWYRVAGGDTETPEYRVQVRATPLVTGFEATYHYRPYLGWRDDTTNDPNLRALRGTEVRLVAHTNRTVSVKVSRLEIDLPRAGPAGGSAGANQRVAADAARAPDVLRKTVAAEAVPGDPQALAFRMVLEESGKYHIAFTSVEKEANADPTTYSIQVLQDHAPVVELTKPGQDVTLPANGLLQLEGTATDDIGLTGMALHLRVADGPEFRRHPYRGGKSFQLAEGGYPRTLPYRDFVELDKIQNADGKPVKLEPKTVLEYWLEATDDCDYPGPNVGKSRTYKVTIGDPDADQKKQEQQRQQAKQEQEKHETKQDEQLKKEGQEPRPDTNPDHPQPNQPDQAKQEKPGEKSQQPDKPDNQRNPQPQPGQKPGENPKNGNQPGEQENNPGQKNGAPKDNAGQKSGAEPQGPQDPREQQAQRLANAVEQQREQRGEGKGEPAKEPKGEKKGPGQGEAQPNAAQKKEGQPGAQGAAQNKEGERKPDGAGQAKEQRPQTGDRKDGAGAAKAEPQAGPHGDKKPDGPQGAGQEPKAAPKEGGPQQTGGAPKAAAKPTQEKDGNHGMPQGEAKDQGSPKDPAEARPQDVQRLAEKMRQGDEKQSQAAEKQLEQVSRQAQDPAARKAAQQALEQRAEEKKQESAPAAAKPQPKPSDPKEGSQSGACQCKSGGSNPKAGEGKGSGPGQGSEPKGASKGGGKQIAQGNPSQQGNGEKSGKPADENAPGSCKPGPGSGQGAKSGEARASGTGGGGTPGGQMVGGRPRPGNVTSNDHTPPEEMPPQERPAPDQPKRAGELVLEDLRKTLDYLKKHPQEMKQVLKRAGMEQRDVRDVEDYLNEKLPPPQQTGTLSNLGARQAATGKTDTSGARATTPAGPPPGFRSSTREFTRKLSETDKD